MPTKACGFFWRPTARNDHVSAIPTTMQKANPMTRSAPDWDALQRAIEGELIRPDAPAYEAARRSAMARFHDIRPQAVVRCQHPTDVAATIAFARRFTLPTAIRGGGHCFAGRSSTPGVVIDVAPMNSVTVADDLATIGAGARLGAIYDALDQHGRTIPAGCGPDVGIAGLTLGGGLGILGRTHGLTSDSLLAAEVVLADGSVVHCDDAHDADLFWALRGAGGGNFGVVTSLVFRTIPPPTATSFHVTWPYALAGELIGAWQTWAFDAPDALAAGLHLTASSDVARPPLVHVFGAMLGTEATTAPLFADLAARVGADPTSATWTTRPYRATKRYLSEHGLDAEGGDEPTSDGHQYSTSEFFGQCLPVEAITSLVETFVANRMSGESRELDFTPWGGAYNRVPADATAFVHRDARFLLQHTATIHPDASTEDRAATGRWLTRSWTAVHPWATGGVYPNFPDPDLDDWATAYYGTNLARLGRIKAHYDPDNVFQFHQSVPTSVT